MEGNRAWLVANDFRRVQSPAPRIRGPFVSYNPQTIAELELRAQNDRLVILTNRFGGQEYSSDCVLGDPAPLRLICNRRIARDEIDVGTGAAARLRCIGHTAEPDSEQHVVATVRSVS